MSIVVFTTFQAKQNKIMPLKKALQALLVPTRQENGCIEYELHQSFTERNEFYLYQIWADRQTLEAHYQKQHTKNFIELSKEMLEKPAIVKFASKVDSHS